MNTEPFSKLIGRPATVEPLPATARYPQDVLLWESAKSGIGAAVCVGVLVALEPSPWIGWPVALVAGLFAAYLLQQVRRIPLRFDVDDTGVTRIRGGRRTALRWEQLNSLRLNYYPNGRKAASGTLVLVLRNGSQRFKVDSNLDHFATLLARAAQAARSKGLELHPTTEANLAQLGL